MKKQVKFELSKFQENEDEILKIAETESVILTKDNKQYVFISDEKLRDVFATLIKESMNLGIRHGVVETCDVVLTSLDTEEGYEKNETLDNPSGSLYAEG